MGFELADGSVGLHTVGRPCTKQYLPSLGITPRVVFPDRSSQVEIAWVEHRCHCIEQTGSLRHRFGKLQASHIQVPHGFILQISVGCRLLRCGCYLALHNLVSIKFELDSL